MTIRMGLLGLGSMGRHHARLIHQTEGVELVAVADPAGDPYGIAAGLPVQPSVEALIDQGIDAAVVAVPTAAHESAALPLAAAGIHAMVEKPLAPDVAGGTRITEAFESAGLVGAVGYVERCNAAIVQLRRRIQAGQLGEIYQITTTRQSPFPKRIADVGVVKDLATHDIDLTAWLAGADYADIHAEVAHRAGRPHEDMVLAHGRLSNGIIVAHTVNWLAPFKERRTTVIGANGAFIADTTVGDLTYYANATVASEWEELAAFRGPSEGDVTRYAFPKPEPLAVEHEHFIAALRGERSDVVRMRDGLRTLEVTERLLRSAGSNL